MIISLHARQRYVERINPALTLDQAADAIRGHTRALDAAESMNSRVFIRLASGARFLVEGDRVVTVLAPGQCTKESM